MADNQDAKVDEDGTFWVTLTVNGSVETRLVEPRVTLADFLRRELDLCGTHLGCEHGSCGACTVIVDGDAVRSCLMLAVQAQGRVVETVEGLGEEGALSPLQQSFQQCHAVQCGYCTGGFLMSLTARLRQGPIVNEDQAREALSGNVCRCTGYAGMVDALLSLSGGAPTTSDK
ncbi:MAG TPA: (2Fe-2S)-binding protein [Nocardioidaceae bacterium]|nr:(2Fe-2S)-binding protein [Nocardioidaceae bacterium]